MDSQPEDSHLQENADYLKNLFIFSKEILLIFCIHVRENASIFFMQKFKTYQLAVQFYHKSNKLTLKGPMKNQFQRAVLSIVLNLAEGSAKSSSKERRKFYEISLGSLRETQAILILINHQVLIKEADKLGAFLYKLCQNT